MNYEKDIRIDESALDVEWLNQPTLMMRYSRHATQMKQEMDFAKERVEYVKAELDKKIRSHPEDFDLEKVTETVVMNTILIQEDYVEAIATFNEARFEFDVALGAVRSIEQRKTALENLVKLFGQQYFAGPSVPRDLSKEWERKEKQKKSNSAVAGKMTRTKK